MANGLVGVGDGETIQAATKNAALALCLACWPHYARNTPPASAAKLLRNAVPFACLEPFDGMEASLAVIGSGGGGAEGTATTAAGGAVPSLSGSDDPLRLRSGEVITIERAREFLDWYTKFYKCVEHGPESCWESALRSRAGSQLHE